MPVDPKLMAEQPDTFSGYAIDRRWRRLFAKDERANVVEEDKQPAPVVAVSAELNNPYQGRERRRSIRFRRSGSAEFCVEGSDVRMWGTLAT